MSKRKKPGPGAEKPAAGTEDRSDAEEAAKPEPAAEPEEPEAAAQEAEEGGAEQAEPAEDPLATAEAEIADLKDRLLRAMAETENVRKRGARERDEASKYAMSAFARDLLPVADNLRRAVSSVPEEVKNGDPAVAALIEGVELTERELLAIFERHGIRRIDALGEKFDHNVHQAVVELEAPDQEPGTVVEVIQTGYLISDRLLRPAMVAVAKGDDQPGGPGQKVDTTA